MIVACSFALHDPHVDSFALSVLPFALFYLHFPCTLLALFSFRTVLTAAPLQKSMMSQSGSAATLDPRR